MPAASRKTLLFSIAAIILVLAVSHYATTHADAYSEALTIGTGVSDFGALSERFIALAEKRGAVYAFDVLRMAQLPPGTDLHLLGHVVGDELYKQQGIDGIEYCTQEFRNACSHSIVIGVLNEFGAVDSTIKKIQDACMLAPGGPGAYTMCFHGLGHGVFAYFGYDIPKTVAFCKRLGTDQYRQQEYTQCVGGMIMELIDGGGHDHDRWTVAHGRYLDPADPLAPCDRSLIPEDAKNFCYIYLTPHLFEAAGAALAQPDPATFPTAFHFCDAIAESDLRDVCYGGFGKEFVPLSAARDIRSIDQMTDQEYGHVIDWCMLGGSAEATGACMDQALSSVYWGGENSADASFRFCALAQDQSARTACYGSLTRNIGLYQSGGEKERQCGNLPQEFQTGCRSESSL
jgi:hypothetical protein